MVTTREDPDVVMIRKHYAVLPEHVSFTGVFLQIAALAAVCWAMYQPLAAPLRLATVYLHEAGHAFAALATGGSVHALQVTPDEGGVVKSEGGMRVLISAAGYLFSALMGVACLAGSRRQSSGGPACLAVIGVAMAGGVAFAMDRGTQQCAFLLAAAALATGFLCWSRLTWPLGSLLLRFVGTFWCLYTAFDVYYDVWGSPPAGMFPAENDAVSMHHEVGVPPIVIAGFGILLILLMTLAAAIWSVLLNPLRVQVRGSAAGLR